MEPYQLVKTLHIIGAALLLGTGVGIAFFFRAGVESGNDQAAHFAARVALKADFLFTLTAILVQPLTGAWLIWQGGFDPGAPWLVLSYALLLVTAACWVPILITQVQIQDQLKAKLATRPFDEGSYRRLRRKWWVLRSLTLVAIVLIIHLMVVKSI